MTQNTPELKPCPFCGGINLTILKKCVRCDDCGAQSGWVDDCGDYQNVIGSWSTRAPSPNPLDELTAETERLGLYPWQGQSIGIDYSQGRDETCVVVREGGLIKKMLLGKEAEDYLAIQTDAPQSQIPTEPMSAGWLADKICVLGDYGKGAAYKLRAQATLLDEMAEALGQALLRMRKVEEARTRPELNGWYPAVEAAIEYIEAILAKYKEQVK